MEQKEQKLQDMYEVNYRSKRIHSNHINQIPNYAIRRSHFDDNNYEGQNYQQYIHYTYEDVDSGFKYFKNNQLLALQQLKNEYQILKSLQIDDKIHLPNKNTDSVQSSSRVQKSQATSRSKISKKGSGIRDTHLLALEKKQLQLVITNNMKKIQQLLHQQTEYKKQIHQFRLLLQDKSDNEKYEQLVKKSKKRQSQLQQCIEVLKRDNEKLKNLSNEHLQKYCKLEEQLNAKQAQLRKQHEETRKQQNLTRLERDKYLNLELDYKRLKMECQITIKQKDHQIKILKRDLDELDTNRSRSRADVQKIRELQAELDMKTKRYNLLLDELNENKKTEENGNMKNFIQALVGERDKMKDQLARSQRLNEQSKKDQSKEIFSKINELQIQNLSLRNELKRITQTIPNEESKNQAFLKALQQIASRINKNSEGEVGEAYNKMTNSMIGQIQSLKNQIQTMKVSPETLDKLRQQQKIIIELQSIIDQENIQKSKFIEEVKDMRESYEQIFNANEALRGKMNMFAEKEIQHKLQIQSLKNEISMLGNKNIDLTASKAQNYNLRIKVGDLQRLETNNEGLKKQLELQRQKNKISQQKYTQQIRNYRRTIDQTNFEVTKAKRQLQFNMDLLRKNHDYQLKKMKEEMQKIMKEKQECLLLIDEINQQRKKDKFGQEQIRKAVDRQKQQIRTIYESKLKEKDNERIIVIKEHESQLDSIRHRNQNQIAMLISRCESLTQANSQFMKKNQHYISIESQLMQLRKYAKSFRGINEGVDHLWQIKETEYVNINELISQLKSNFSEIQ